MTDIKNQFNGGIINNPVFNYNGKSIRKHIGNIPIEPEVFLGREGEIETIHDKLFESQTLLLVNGEGGIGKTTVAAVYYRKYIEEYKHLFWYIVENNIEEIFLESITTSLKIKVEDNATKKEILNAVLIEISNLNSPILIVIDNANKLKHLDESYEYLRKFPNVHFLLTTRITEFRKASFLPIGKIDYNFLKQIFEEYYENLSTKNEILFKGILEAVNHNTLVVELLAKTLKSLNRNETKYSLSSLLQDLQKKGLLRLTLSKEIDTDYKEYKKTTVEDIVEAMYNISDLSNAEKSLLSVFAVLPTISIPYNNLKMLVANHSGLEINLELLSKKGWIEFDQEQKSYKGNTIINEIALKQNKGDLEKDTSILCENLEKYIQYNENEHFENYEQSLGFIEYSKSIINRIPKRDNSFLTRLIGEFYINYGGLTLALEHFEKYNCHFKELYESNPKNVAFKNGLAISYEKLGETHTALGNLDKALKFFEEFTKLMKEL